MIDRMRRRSRVTTCGLCLACLAYMLLSPPSGAGARRHATALRAQISFTGRSHSIPRSFFGIGLEYTELRTFEADGELFDRAVALMRPENERTLVLRIGGKSANDVYWQTPRGNGPHWIFEIGPGWVRQLVSLVRRDRFRILLNLNLPVHSPTMAAAFAKAVAHALGRRGLAGLSVGNEPDLYYHQPGLDRERVPSTLPSTPSDWALNYTPADYWRDFHAYARALKRVVPRIPLAGPEVPSYQKVWVNSIRGPRHGGPRIFAIHRYAGSTCWGPKRLPSFAALLGQPDGGASAWAPAVAEARARGVKLRLTEVNSISMCKPENPVADSFATALWAPDALFSIIEGGVSGVNFHIRTKLPNAPFAIQDGVFEARPELYGLALFAEMLRPGARLVGTATTLSSYALLKTWAVRTRSGTRVLLINKGSRAVASQVPVTASSGRARVWRLQAPSVRATSGVRLAGRAIGRSGRWSGSRVTGWARIRGGTYRVYVPPYSAAVLDIPASQLS
jgi:hypothetical protein